MIMSITSKFEAEILPRISFIARADPVRVLSIAYKAIKLAAITIVFIDPTKIMKLFLVCLTISELMNAECPDPTPGRKENIGEINMAGIIERKMSLLSIFNSFIFIILCLGRVILLFEERTKEDRPNNPPKSGSKGSLFGS